MPQVFPEESGRYVECVMFLADGHAVRFCKDVGIDGRERWRSREKLSSRADAHTRERKYNEKINKIRFLF